MTEHYTPETLEKGARALWDAQTRQKWQEVGDDEWPSWVDLAARDRLRERARAVLDATADDLWNEGYRAGNLDGYFGTSDERDARAARLREGD
jgi:hypothetical protein